MRRRRLEKGTGQAAGMDIALWRGIEATMTNDITDITCAVVAARRPLRPNFDR